VRPAKPPKYTGKGAPGIDEWIFALERLCEGQPDDTRVRVASSLLEGAALTWWATRYNNQQVWTWGDF
jgi:hypothetical protein